MHKSQQPDSNEEAHHSPFSAGAAQGAGGVFAEIIIPLALPQNYTWSVPAEFQHAAKPGMRVEVQLRNKRYSGIIKKLLA
jgi:hypothetical protein